MENNNEAAIYLRFFYVKKLITTSDFCNFIKILIMKKLLAILVVITCIISCQTQKTNLGKTDDNLSKNDTIKIANEELEYEIIIIDAGFNSWLLSRARPRGYYSESYLEIKNQFYVTSWNSRVGQPMQFNPNLYEMRIDYDPKIHYGYEVNYLLYNYFIYFQERNR